MRGLEPIEGVCDRSFFQLVQQLVRLREGAIAPGGGGPPRHETIRFRPNASLGFPASDVAAVERYELPGEEIPLRYRVTVNFMGLYGPASPMPNHFTEEMLWADGEGEIQRDFLDLFHHRMISFVYRAWLKYRHWAHYRAGGKDATTPLYLGLIGMGTDGLVEASRISPFALLRCAGLLGGGPRSAAGLRALLRDQFDQVPLEVTSFLRRVVTLPGDQCSRLGAASCRLGKSVILGERVVDRATAFGLTLGPLSAAEFEQWLPGGERFQRMVRLVRFYLRDPLDAVVTLKLEAPEVPALRLGERRPLGQMSWLLPTGRAEGRVELKTVRFDPLRAA